MTTPLTSKPLYPTMTNVEDVQKWAGSLLPITDKNELTAVLMTYHNTLLKEVKTRGIPEGK